MAGGSGPAGAEATGKAEGKPQRLSGSSRHGGSRRLRAFPGCAATGSSRRSQDGLCG